MICILMNEFSTAELYYTWTSKQAIREWLEDDSHGPREVAGVAGGIPTGVEVLAVSSVRLNFILDSPVLSNRRIAYGWQNLPLKGSNFIGLKALHYFSDDSSCLMKHCGMLSEILQCPLP